MGARRAGAPRGVWLVACRGHGALRVGTRTLRTVQGRGGEEDLAEMPIPLLVLESSRRHGWLRFEILVRTGSTGICIEDSYGESPPLLARLEAPVWPTAGPELGQAIRPVFFPNRFGKTSGS
eukprot:182289-Pyramimonas_sp.AAC.1